MQAALPPIPAKRPSPRFPPCGPGNVATSSLPISLRSPGRSFCGSFPLAFAVKKIPQFGKQTLCAAGARLRERQKCARPVPVLRTATGGLPRVMVRSPVAQRAAVFSLHGGGWPPATEVWSKRNGAACKTPGRKLLPKPGLGARVVGTSNRRRTRAPAPRGPRPAGRTGREDGGEISRSARTREPSRGTDASRQAVPPPDAMASHVHGLGSRVTGAARGALRIEGPDLGGRPGCGNSQAARPSLPLRPAAESAIVDKEPVFNQVEKAGDRSMAGKTGLGRCGTEKARGAIPAPPPRRDPVSRPRGLPARRPFAFLSVAAVAACLLPGLSAQAQDRLRLGNPGTNSAFVSGESISVTLPAATGGTAPYTYTLTRAGGLSRDGLSFDPATRVLSGTAPPLFPVERPSALQWHHLPGSRFHLPRHRQRRHRGHAGRRRILSP